MSALWSWLRRIFGRTARASILRQEINDREWSRDPAGELMRAAIKVQRARCSHLVTEATALELDALARAAERLEDEHATLLAAKFRDFAKALEPYDGGEAVQDEILDLMEASWAARAAKRKGR